MTALTVECERPHYSRERRRLTVPEVTNMGARAMAAGARFLEAGNYHAYLLRLTRADAAHPWEIVAKDVETGEEYPLADPAALIAFLPERVPMLQPREQRSRHER